MKLTCPSLLVAALLALAPLAGRAASVPTPATDATPPPPPPPKSSFVIDPKFGKDPFFPTSTRLTKLIPQITNEVVTPPPQPQFPEDIRCQGIAGSPNRRIAIVNGKSIEKGESIEFRLPSGTTVKAVCLDIREFSVVLEVNGVTKELPLRASLK